MKNVYKFVSWDVPALKELKDFPAYKAMEKLNNGEKLDRDEKDMLQRSFNGNGIVKRVGWCFDFKPYIHKYLVKTKCYGWKDMHGFDKTAIRNADIVKSHVLKIIELED